MKRIECLMAVCAVLVVAGCKSGEGESPSLSQKESADFTGEQKLPQIGPRSDSGPMSVAGEAVSQPAKPERPGNILTPKGMPSSPRMATPAATPPMTERPYVPRMPMADKEVNGSYSDSTGLSVSIEAVCKVTEDSVVCWKPNGSRDKNLEAKLDQILQGQQNMYSPALTFKYKKRNRLILFRLQQPTSAEGRGAMASIRQVGEDMGFGYFNVSSLRDPSSANANFNYEMRAVSVPPGQKTVNAIIGVTRPTPMPGVLPMAKGGNLSSGKNSITFVSSKPADASMYGANGKAWELTFKVVRENPQMNLSINPIVKNNTTGYALVDQNGDLVKPNTDNRAVSMESRGPRMFSSSVMAMPMGMFGKDFKFRLNVNPKYVTGFTVVMFETSTIKIKNIKLHD